MAGCELTVRSSCSCGPSNDERRERLAERDVGRSEHGRRGEDSAMGLAHADVLRALAGEDKGELGHESRPP